MISRLESVICYKKASKVPCVSFEVELEDGLNVVHAPNGSGKTTLLSSFHPLLGVWGALGSGYEEPLLKLTFANYMSLKQPMPAVGYVKTEDNAVLWFDDASLARSLSKMYDVEDLYQRALDCEGPLELISDDYMFTASHQTIYKFSLLGSGSACGYMKGNALVLASEIPYIERYIVYYSPRMTLINDFQRTLYTEFLRSSQGKEGIVEELRDVIPNLVDLRLGGSELGALLFVEEEGDVIELDPSVIGDGQRSLLALRILGLLYSNKSKMLVADTPEAFVYSDDYDKVVSWIKSLASEQGIVTTWSDELYTKLLDTSATPLTVKDKGTSERSEDNFTFIIKNKQVVRM